MSTPGPDLILGTNFDEIYLGLAGNDTLKGSAGFDTLDGGLGSDVADYSSIGTVVSLGAFGVLQKGGFTDRLFSIETVIGSSLLGDTIDHSGAVTGGGFTVTGTTTDLNLGFAKVNGSPFPLPLQINVQNFENVIGSIYSDSITGNNSDNILNGGTGVDTMAGGAGNDTYVVDNAGDIVIEAAAAGTDTVQSSITYTLGANLENLILTGAAAINGTGNTGNNILTGNTGNNSLNGGAGADNMAGGLGDDTYVVDNIGDVVTEAAGAGTDTVQSSITYTLGANLENLTLTGAAAINGTGNTSNNILTGNTGNNILNGGTGADNMAGGLGDDTYVVDNALDVVTEAAGAGTDTVQSSITYTLGANLENLTLTGAAAINGTGNTSNNILTGNTGNNILSGGDGNDTLNGGAGADTLIGGFGNDTYVVDNAGDSVIENSGAGTDTVQSSISYTLGANLENLTLTGAAAISGTGNDLNNVIQGNAANNTLTGGLGSDTLNGGNGNDTFVYTSISDSAFGPSNQDTITGFQLSGLFGVDRLDLSAIDANLTVAGNQAFTFIGLIGGAPGNPVFSNAGQLGYQVIGGNLFLYGNVDPNPTANFALQLSGLTSITAANITL